MAKPQTIRQSICVVCGRAVRAGAGIVLGYGGAGRVHPELSEEVNDEQKTQPQA